jgi:hypothetical protein
MEVTVVDDKIGQTMRTARWHGQRDVRVEEVPAVPIPRRFPGPTRAWSRSSGAASAAPTWKSTATAP